MYKIYTLVIDNITKIVWLVLMLHWLSDGVKITDLIK